MRDEESSTYCPVHDPKGLGDDSREALLLSNQYSETSSINQYLLVFPPLETADSECVWRKRVGVESSGFQNPKELQGIATPLEQHLGMRGNAYCPRIAHAFFYAVFLSGSTI